ncbi:MAG TPA: MFS transporter [Ktedonobacterales bacterium]|nr:MFS transporter [Ktedonobacterales bacterium]
MSSIEAKAPTRKPCLLINRDFALLWLGQSVSSIGDALLDFTLVLWIVFDLGRGQAWAPLAVSGVLVSSSMGTLVIGPIAGVFVDRWDKRQTLLWVTAVQAMLTASLLLAADLVPLPFFVGGQPSLTVKLAMLYTVIFLVYGCAQFTRSARTALIGDLVEERDRPQASGLMETMASLAFLIGFGIAPVLFVPFGIGVALFADALSFVVAFAALLGVKAPPSARSVAAGRRGSVRGEFFEGVRFSLGNLVIRTLLVVYVIVLFGSGAINALFVFFLSEDLHAPAAAIGVFPVALGVGLVLGSILGGALARRVGLTRIFWISVVLLGICAITLSRQTSLAAALVLAFLLGIPNGVMNVALMPLVLHVTPKELVGRVMTVLEPAMTVAQVASMAVFGTLASTVFFGFKASVLGAKFDTYNVLILIPGLLCLLAGAIAFASLRHVSLRLAAAHQVDDGA